MPRPLKAAPPPPPDLSETSRVRWPGFAADVAATCGGSEIDYELLAELFRSQERLEQVRAVLLADGPTVAGSQGQTRPHPMLAAERTLVREVADAYRRLRLAPEVRSNYVQVTAAGRIVPY